MPVPETRRQSINRLFPDLPSYRLRQAEAAVFSSEWSGWEDVSPLPAGMRERLAAEIPWISHNDHLIQESSAKDAYKAALRQLDGLGIETVLMRNRRGHWTVCVSSQVGCAMRCAFCATGTLGLKRDLNADEIIDQYRFWRRLMRQENMAGQITNVVFMGMGEPLANYDAVKDALQQLLANTDIGPTRITVSTVGLIPVLNRLLDDPDWPAVRLAISLHSADQATREALMPTTHGSFLADLSGWAARYLKKFGNRRRHLTFEYLMLDGVNDSKEHANQLIRFAKSLGRIKINLIPYNATEAAYEGTAPQQIRQFADWLSEAGLDVTRRRSLGQDIDAACGQLANK